MAGEEGCWEREREGKKKNPESSFPSRLCPPIFFSSFSSENMKILCFHGLEMLLLPQLRLLFGQRLQAT